MKQTKKQLEEEIEQDTKVIQEYMVLAADRGIQLEKVNKLLLEVYKELEFHKWDMTRTGIKLYRYLEENKLI